MSDGITMVEKDHYVYVKQTNDGILFLSSPWMTYDWLETIGR